MTVTVSRSVQTEDGTGLGSDYTFSFAAIGSTPTPISVGGTLSADTTWTAPNVYLVTSDVTIPAGRTLAIQGGVVVQDSYGRRRHVYLSRSVTSMNDRARIAIADQPPSGFQSQTIR